MVDDDEAAQLKAVTLLVRSMQASGLQSSTYYAKRLYPATERAVRASDCVTIIMPKCHCIGALCAYAIVTAETFSQHNMSVNW
jgi:hypothetical protein